MWYTASILFIGEHPAPAEPMWEEQILLLQCMDEAAAKARAEQIARGQEHSYLTVEGGQVKWQFYAVERIYAMDLVVPGDGAQVFSRFLRDSEAKSLLVPFSDNP